VTHERGLIFEKSESMDVTEFDKMTNLLAMRTSSSFSIKFNTKSS